MDLCTSARAILTPDMGVQAVPTGVFGPLPPSTWGLILGRSSIALKGIQVFPGVIDSDYQGEIKIMVASPRGVLVIPLGERIAQLILMPMLKGSNKIIHSSRGNKGFGSTGSASVFWTAELHQRPELELVISGKKFKGLLDTGADTSVISQQFWPPSWPTQPAKTRVAGIGGSPSVMQSVNYLNWADNEGHSGTFLPYIIADLPVNLWGRDIMEAMGAVLTTQMITPQRMLQRWGWKEGQGLGKQQQGQSTCISVLEESLRKGGDRTGLGSSNLS